MHTQVLRRAFGLSPLSVHTREQAALDNKNSKKKKTTSSKKPRKKTAPSKKSEVEIVAISSITDPFSTEDFHEQELSTVSTSTKQARLSEMFKQDVDASASPARRLGALNSEKIVQMVPVDKASSSKALKKTAAKAPKRKAPASSSSSLQTTPFNLKKPKVPPTSSPRELGAIQLE